MRKELRLRRGVLTLILLGVTGLAPWGAVSIVQAASAMASNQAVAVTATGEGVLAVQSVGTDFDVIVSDDSAPVTVTLAARSGGTLVEPPTGSSSQLPFTYRVEFLANRGEDVAEGKVRRADIKVELEISNNCKVSATSGLVSPWPHSIFWKPGGYKEPSIPDYLTRNAANLQVKLMPLSADIMEYSLKRHYATWTHTMDDISKPGGVYEYEIDDAAWRVEATWGPITSRLNIHNGGDRVLLPYWGVFQPTNLKSYAKLMPVMDAIDGAQGLLNSAIDAIFNNIPLFPASRKPSIDVSYHKHLQEMLPDVWVRRRHEVWLWDCDECCLRAEKDLQEIRFKLANSHDTDAEDNIKDNASQLADSIYNYAMPKAIDEWLDYDYLQIEGLYDGFNPANWIKNELSSYIRERIYIALSADYDVDVTRRFEFCAEQGFAREIQNTEYTGVASATSLASIQVFIPSTKQLFYDAQNGDVYEWLKNQFNRGHEWGWGNIRLLLPRTDNELTWSGGLLGEVGRDEKGVYGDNLIRYFWRQRVAAGIWWSSAQKPTEYTGHGFHVKQWNPLSVDFLAYGSPVVAYPYVFDGEPMRKRIYMRDYFHNPCEH